MAEDSTTFSGFHSAKRLADGPARGVVGHWPVERRRRLGYMSSDSKAWGDVPAPSWRTTIRLVKGV